MTFYPQTAGVFWNKSFGDRWSHVQSQWFSGGCGRSSVFTRSLHVYRSGQSHAYCNWYEIWGVYFNVIRILIIGLIRSDCFVRMTLIKPGFSGLKKKTTKKKNNLGETGCKISRTDHWIADGSSANQNSNFAKVTRGGLPSKSIFLFLQDCDSSQFLSCYTYIYGI